MGTVNSGAGSRVYVDTNMVIYFIEGFPAAGSLRAWFARVDAGELQAVTSELTLAEALVKPIRDGRQAVRAQYERFLRAGGPLVVSPVTRPVLVEAAAIRAQSTIKLPDAIHLATARLEGCTGFLTNDQRFGSVSTPTVITLADLTA